MEDASCRRPHILHATANQFRLFLHAGAYWLMWGLRAAMPRRSSFAVAQFDTLRVRLIRIAARVVEMKSQIRLHLLTSCPTGASGASPSIASLNSRHNDRAQTPRNELVDRNLLTPACHHDGAIPAPDQARVKNGDHSVASGRQKLIAAHQGGQNVVGIALTKVGHDEVDARAELGGTMRMAVLCVGEPTWVASRPFSLLQHGFFQVPSALIQ